MKNETLSYIETQIHRLDANQMKFVRTIQNLPDDSMLTKSDEKYLVNLWIWLNSPSGDVVGKKLSPFSGIKARPAKAKKSKFKKRKSKGY